MTKPASQSSISQSLVLQDSNAAASGQTLRPTLVRQGSHGPGARPARESEVNTMPLASNVYATESRVDPEASFRRSRVVDYLGQQLLANFDALTTVLNAGIEDSVVRQTVTELRAEMIEKLSQIMASRAVL